MSSSATPLPATEVAARLLSHPGWRLLEGALTREFAFDTYASALDFVNRVAAVAERHDHHPDLLLTWRRVAARLWSHDAAGVTERDFRLAGAIDRLFPLGPASSREER